MRRIKNKILAIRINERAKKQPQEEADRLEISLSELVLKYLQINN